MDPRFEKVDALFALYDKTNSPGCSLAIFQDGKTLFSRGYGMANLEHSVPNQAWTRYYLASMSKQFTAFSIALLEEAGKLSLDDDIRTWFPQIPAYQAPVTVRQLVHHSSGLRDYLGLAFMAGRPLEDIIVEEETLELLSRQKELNFTPGAEYLYSNSGYILLAMIVARVSGKSFRQFAHENIFEPLEMKHTHAHDNHLEPVPQRATGYEPTPNGYRIAVPNFDMVGDGGIYSNVQDLFLWDQNFYHNRLGQGRQELIERVLTRGQLNNGETISYAFGLSINEYKGLREVAHSGGYGGYATEMIRYPEQGFSAVVLGNCGGLRPSDMVHKIVDIFLEEQFIKTGEQAAAKAEFITLPISDLQAKTGLYYSPATGWSMDLIEKEGRLCAEVFDTALTLLPVEANTFVTDAAPLDARLVFNGKGLDLTIGSGKAIEFERLEVVTPSKEDLAGLCGRYFSAELQAGCEIYLQDDQPVFKIRQNRQDIKPGSKNMYLVAQGALLAKRGAANEVTEFRVQAGRVRNILFERV